MEMLPCGLYLKEKPGAKNTDRKASIPFNKKLSAYLEESPITQVHIIW